MDKEKFAQAVDAVLHGERVRDGIGTLSEKTLHAVLKRYFEPECENQEIKIGGYVADIVGEDGIIEIQTANFNRLRGKLDAFLEAARVTVVYPVAECKRLSWVDPDTGEASPARKCPKRGAAYAVFDELYKISAQLNHPNLTIHVVLLELTEYRYLNGWSRNKKRRSARAERIPQDITGEVILRRPEDYAVFVPESLPEAFTVQEYRKAVGVSTGTAQTALRILTQVGVVRRVGKQGRAFLYERGSTACSE